MRYSFVGILIAALVAGGRAQAVEAMLAGVAEDGAPRTSLRVGLSGGVLPPMPPIGLVLDASLGHSFGTRVFAHGRIAAGTALGSTDDCFVASGESLLPSGTALAGGAGVSVRAAQLGTQWLAFDVAALSGSSPSCGPRDFSQGAMTVALEAASWRLGVGGFLHANHEPDSVTWIAGAMADATWAFGDPGDPVRPYVRVAALLLSDGGAVPGGGVALGGGGQLGLAVRLD